MKQTRRSFIKSALAAVIVATTPLPKLPKMITKKAVKYSSMSLLELADILSETNELLKDIHWVEAK